MENGPILGVFLLLCAEICIRGFVKDIQAFPFQGHLFLPFGGGRSETNKIHFFSKKCEAR